MEGITDTRVHGNRELLRLGLGNAVTACFGGISSGINLGSSSANYRGGGRTSASVLISALFISLTVIALGPVIAYIPRAVIAGLLTIVAIQPVDPWTIQVVRQLFAQLSFESSSVMRLRRRFEGCTVMDAGRPRRYSRRMSRIVVLTILALAGFLTGCNQDEVVRTMIPAPIIMRDGRFDFTQWVTPENQTTDVRVLYATTRAPAPAGAREHYLRRPGDKVRLGLAHVQLGEPGWSFADLVESDRTSSITTPRPARVTSVEAFGVMGGPADEAFIAAIDRQVEASRTGEAVIYVPGYRVGFDQVITLMGSWAHYLGRSSAVIAFSWPSGTWVWNYFIDCPRARAFIPDIERLIALVAERSKARRLNLIAFSCGSPLLAEALVQLRARHPAQDREALQRRYRIGNALFVAADIDLQTFARSHLPALSDIAARTQVYLSENDFALKFASLFAGASRLGRPRLQELSRDDLETLASNERLVGIDVAGVYGAHELTGMRGHGYWVANERVSTDILLSMIYPFAPARRGLTHKPGRSMWTFPDDYPQRVGDALWELAPGLRRQKP